MVDYHDFVIATPHPPYQIRSQTQYNKHLTLDHEKGYIEKLYSSFIENDEYKVNTLQIFMRPKLWRHLLTKIRIARRKFRGDCVAPSFPPE